MDNMPAGWLPDPQDPWTERFWDGRKWTGQTRVVAELQPPAKRSETAAQPTTPDQPATNPRGRRSGIVFLIGTAVVLGLIVVGVTTMDGGSDDRSETSAAAGPGPACVSAFEAAAAVPLDQINDTEMVRTVKECTTVDEWSAGIERYPEALGMTQAPTRSELPMTLGTVCFGNESAAMCQDAAAQGLLR